MKTLTLQIDDQVSDKFMWLLQHFSASEVKIVELDESIDAHSESANHLSIQVMQSIVDQARETGVSDMSLQQMKQEFIAKR